jgi:hypothetical protein
MSEQKACPYCASTTGCPADKGWPCTEERVFQIERNAGYGKPGDNRSFWE